jgi:hypothetical protein
VGSGLRGAIAVLSLVVGLSACGGGSPDPLADCALPSPDADADASEVPEQFLLDGTATLRRASEEDGLLVFGLNLPYDVSEAVDRFKTSLAPPRYQVLSEDNEGFEAELYFHDKQEDRLLAIQIRRPNCDTASAAFVTIDKRRDRE